MDLKGLNNNSYFVSGFTKTLTKPDKDVKVEMIVKSNNEGYPFIVSNLAKGIIFIASATGGWGSNWFNKYPEGYQVLWKKIIYSFRF
jgi:hypothetical protein